MRRLEPHSGCSRSTVPCSSERPDPVRSCRNFGEFARDSGHNRVPDPPAGITPQKPSIGLDSTSDMTITVVHPGRRGGSRRAFAWGHVLFT